MAVWCFRRNPSFRVKEHQTRVRACVCLWVCSRPSRRPGRVGRQASRVCVAVLACPGFLAGSGWPACRAFACAPHRSCCCLIFLRPSPGCGCPCCCCFFSLCPPCIRLSFISGPLCPLPRQFVGAHLPSPFFCATHLSLPFRCFRPRCLWPWRSDASQPLLLGGTSPSVPLALPLIGLVSFCSHAFRPFVW